MVESVAAFVFCLLRRFDGKFIYSIKICIDIMHNINYNVIACSEFNRKQV